MQRRRIEQEEEKKRDREMEEEEEEKRQREKTKERRQRKREEKGDKEYMAFPRIDPAKHGAFEVSRRLLLIFFQ